MAYSQYIDLVNALRDRFNEVHLSTVNFNTVVGFDQFCKDAINYAYHDIINAEMEWPFLHQTGLISTVPGVQTYEVTTGNTGIIKTIDWDSFYINANPIKAVVAAETATIPSSGTLSISPAQIATWFSDLGVKYTMTGVALTPVDDDPQTGGQYTIKNGAYYFNIADAGQGVTLSYTTSTPSTINVINAVPLVYMDYDLWRQTQLTNDYNASALSAFSIPQSVVKAQTLNDIILSPVPDKIYNINFEYWVDGDDYVNPTDTGLLPTRYNQIIIDGAQKYCYEFREDPQLAQMADARFKAGITRMRIELINRDNTMQTGMYWYPHGFSYTLNTL